MTTQGSRQLKRLKRSDGNHCLNVTWSRNSSTSLSSHACSMPCTKKGRFAFGSLMGSDQDRLKSQYCWSQPLLSSLWPLALTRRTIKCKRSHETSSGLGRADPALRGLSRSQEGRPLARRRGVHGAIEPLASEQARLGPITEIMGRTEIRTFDRGSAVDR